jgi:hypothetical protein
VDIAPPKLNCISGRVLLNLNETMVPRALQNEIENHNSKENNYSSIYPFYDLLYLSPFFTKPNPHFISL